jgi:hypothetical protein
MQNLGKLQLSMLLYWECGSRCLSESVAVEVHELIQDCLQMDT